MTELPKDPLPARASPAASGPAVSRAVALDRVIHERIRLGIVTALVRQGPLTFSDLKQMLETTDGNLSVHARKLEDAGYVSLVKSIESRPPRTEFRLTPAGRSALRRYLDQMEAIARDAREGLARDMASRP